MMRKTVKILGLILALALVAAACSSGSDDTTTTAAGGTDETTTTAVAGTTSQVEVFSWWTGGGEAAGLDAMIVVFGEMYPDIEFVNSAVAGGAGTNARAVLASRLQADDPPDNWQGHAGQELIGTYVAADQVEPLNFLFDEQGWLDVMPETLIPLISKDGNIYSVPVNIHRSNVLWANPTVLADAGIEMPTTLDEFFTALYATGADPVLATEVFNTALAAEGSSQMAKAIASSCSQVLATFV